MVLDCSKSLSFIHQLVDEDDQLDDIPKKRRLGMYMQYVYCCSEIIIWRISEFCIPFSIAEWATQYVAIIFAFFMIGFHNCTKKHTVSERHYYKHCCLRESNFHSYSYCSAIFSHAMVDFCMCEYLFVVCHANS